MHGRTPSQIEDSLFIEILKSDVKEGAFQVYLYQGNGSCYNDLTDWTTKERETEFDLFSGYPTLPVNWGINTADKLDFFSQDW